MKQTSWVAFIEKTDGVQIVGESWDKFWRFRSQMTKLHAAPALQYTWREDALKRFPDAMQVWRLEPKP